MLIGTALYSDIAYSFDAACLRIPVGVARERTRPVLKDAGILSDVESYYLRQKGCDLESFSISVRFAASKCFDYISGSVRKPPFELDSSLEAYMERLRQLSSEELDREFVNVNGVSQVLSRCFYNDISLALYSSANVLKKETVGLEKEKALKTVLILGEWGKRYYCYERRYEKDILPFDFAVTGKLINVISNAPPNGYDYKYEKECAVEAAGVTDEELNKRLGELIGREYDLKRHTCEDIFFDVYMPIIQELDYTLKMCQKGKREEIDYQKLQTASRKIEILLKEWFCRHAWLQGASLSLHLPLRKENIGKAFCAESVFEEDGKEQYFDLYRWKVYNMRGMISRDYRLMRFLEKLGVGKGALVINIGSGRVYDWVKFAAIMGADAIASDVDKETIGTAKRTVQKELLLRRDLLPSDRVKFKEVYRRIKWIGGEAGDIAKLKPPRPAKIVIMEGLIDEEVPLGCYFGSLPVYSDKEIRDFLEKGYELAGEDSYMLVSIYANEREEFKRHVNNFINTKIGIKHEVISFPLSNDSPWFSMNKQATMFVIHVQRQFERVGDIEPRRVAGDL